MRQLQRKHASTTSRGDDRNRDRTGRSTVAVDDANRRRPIGEGHRVVSVAWHLREPGEAILIAVGENCGEPVLIVGDPQREPDRLEHADRFLEQRQDIVHVARAAARPPTGSRPRADVRLAVRSRAIRLRAARRWAVRSRAALTPAGPARILSSQPVRAVLTALPPVLMVQEAAQAEVRFWRRPARGAPQLPGRTPQAECARSPARRAAPGALRTPSAAGTSAASAATALRSGRRFLAPRPRLRACSRAYRDTTPGTRALPRPARVRSRVRSCARRSAGKSRAASA